MALGVIFWMEQTIISSEKIVDELNILEQSLFAKHWTDHSRASFIYAVSNTANSLKKVKELLEEIRKGHEIEPLSEHDLQKHISELEKLIGVLEQNHSLEVSRIKRAKEKGIEFLADDITNPEQYSFLEQKVLGFILKTRFLVERLSLVQRKEMQEGTVIGKSTKKVLELLEEKEKEVQELRKKYEEIKNRHFMARLEEKTSNDLEKELYLLAKKTEGEQKYLESSIESFRKGVEQVQQAFVITREKFLALEELNRKSWEMVSELTTTLKKERDYAKRIVLDIENETIKLRNAYSKQIISLESEKVQAKIHAQHEQKEKAALLKTQLLEKEELAKSLKEIIAAKDKHIEKLEKKAEKKKAKTIPRKTM